MRRVLLMAALLVLGGGLSACKQPLLRSTGDTPALDTARLELEIKPLAAGAAPGVLGFGIMNLVSGETWTLNGERRFPLDDVAALPLGAAAIGEIEGGRLKDGEILPVREVDLAPPPSAIADAWPSRSDYTIHTLVEAAVRGSDTTADDLLIHRIGGPGAVTAWLVDKHVAEVRLDRYRREIDPHRSGLASFRADWKGETAYRQVQASLTPAQRQAAMTAYLADPRDTATPRGMLRFFQALSAGELISHAGMTRLMATIPQDASPGLPPGAHFAHKRAQMAALPGQPGVLNDAGVLTLKDGRRYAIAVFLAGSTQDAKAQADTVARTLAAAGRSVH